MCVCPVTSRFPAHCWAVRTSGGRCSNLRVPPATPAANRNRTPPSAPPPIRAPPLTAAPAPGHDAYHCARSLSYPSVRGFKIRQLIKGKLLNEKFALKSFFRNNNIFSGPIHFSSYFTIITQSTIVHFFKIFLERKTTVV